MNKKIKGYLISNTIVDLKGDSVGESPHIIFKLQSPINKDIYISDNISNLKDEILESLVENKIINDKFNYSVYENKNTYEIEIIENLFVERK